VNSYGWLTPLAIAAAAALVWWINRPRGTPPVVVAEPEVPRAEPGDLYSILEEIRPYYERTAHPKDLLRVAEFQRAVRLLSEPAFTAESLLHYIIADNPIAACVAAEALTQRDRDADLTDQMLSRVGSVVPWADWFLLRYIAERSKRPVAGELFLKAQPALGQFIAAYAGTKEYLNAFLDQRRPLEGAASFAGELDECPPEQVEEIEKILRQLRQDLAEPLLAEITEWRKHRVDVALLLTVGSVWPQRAAADDLVLHDGLRAGLDSLEICFARTPLRPAIVVGESGAGKSVLIREFAQRLQDRGWRIFEASAANVLAGQVHMGELEGRLRNLLDNLAPARRVLWYVPNFPELLSAGRHRYSEVGVLDILFPYIERGAISMIGEAEPRGLELVLQARPRLRPLIDTIRLRGMDADDALEVVLEWASHRALPNGQPAIAPELVRECHQLARHYLGDRGMPGSAFHLMRRTLEQRTAASEPAPASLDGVLSTLAQLTGLPRIVLDDRQDLDIESVRDGFRQRVLGQPEAVDVLVERIAMLKSGLTDPARPFGVFLFAGPTGTGKTEIAKTLAEFLFGSRERMIRLDMSEYATPDAASRMLSDDANGPAVTSLVTSIRRQPFSVILLDEFEKADPSVWDLFLQVFDDGRLTDHRGSTADFRYSIIILTSNLGATISRGTSIGFASGGGSFSPTIVQQAIEKTFRREFVNRLDRIVIFRPLNRNTMREILLKELNDVLKRRGLRKREWAVEWEEPAVEFLLNRGFTPDLGARPLKRAIERYVLAPLAVTIVKRQFPEGDQFLFLRSDGNGIQVEFVDPDAPETPAQRGAGEAPEETAAKEGRLQDIALEPSGSAEEAALVTGTYQTLQARVDAEQWQKRKREALAQTNSLTFWDQPERFGVLSEIEFMDRVESGLATAGSLLERLTGSRRTTRRHYAPALMRRMAEQLYLLRTAIDGFEKDEPRDALLLVEGGQSRSAEQESARLFRSIVAMYQRWASKRRMQQQILVEGPARVVLAISGFGAYQILAPETGLHVWDIPTSEHASARFQVTVRVAPQPDEPRYDDRARREQAEQILASAAQPALGVVRRYREEPSPLVRDNVAGWRTGRLDRVLDGDFDLL